MQACDALDGVVDGLISNQARCNAMFDPATARVNGTPLRCPGGADTGDTCLSDAQITALKTINTDDAASTSALASGETTTPATTSGARTSASPPTRRRCEPTVTFLAPRHRRSRRCRCRPRAPYISRAARPVDPVRITRDPALQLAVARPGEPRPVGRAHQRAEHACSTSARDISTLRRAGAASCCSRTALSDVLVSTRATEEYYQRLQAQMGAGQGRQLRPLLRGPGLRPRRQHDLQRGLGLAHGARELGREGHRAERPGDDRHRRRPGRTRPLCDYPKWPQYNGTGDVNLAASFTCVGQETVPATQRQTAFGTVVGTDNSATSGTYAWKGVPFAKPPVGDLRWKAPVDPDAVDVAQVHAAVRQRLRRSRAACTARAEQHVRRDDRHVARPDGRLGRLPLPEHLAAGRRGRAAAGDRLGARRQQHLRLHRPIRCTTARTSRAPPTPSSSR